MNIFVGYSNILSLSIMDALKVRNNVTQILGEDCGKSTKGGGGEVERRCVTSARERAEMMNEQWQHEGCVAR